MATENSSHWCAVLVLAVSLTATSCTTKDSHQADARVENPSEAAPSPPSSQSTDLRSSPAEPSPSVQLEPAEVVRIQVEALGNNDDADSGIATAFRFASSRNRRVTGPIQRFARMMKGTEYQGLLNHRRVDYPPITRHQDVAQQLVVVETNQGDSQSFLFILSQEQDGPHRRCWMTDAVIRGRLEFAASQPSSRAKND